MVCLMHESIMESSTALLNATWHLLLRQNTWQSAAWPCHLAIASKHVKFSAGLPALDVFASSQFNGELQAHS